MVLPQMRVYTVKLDFFACTALKRRGTTVHEPIPIPMSSSFSCVVDAVREARRNTHFSLENRSDIYTHLKVRDIERRKIKTNGKKHASRHPIRIKSKSDA